MVVSGTPKDSLHLIDLIYRQEPDNRPEVIISDTGSYSDGSMSRSVANPNRHGHCHSGRSKTVDPRRKHSQRRENDTAFGPGNRSAALRNAITPAEPHPNDFTLDSAGVLQRARAHIEQGPDHRRVCRDRERVVQVLNDALATEFVRGWSQNDEHELTDLGQSLGSAAAATL